MKQSESSGLSHRPCLAFGGCSSILGPRELRDAGGSPRPLIHRAVPCADMSAATPIVLIHGFWHGAWCWSPLVEEFASRGLPAVAVDMEGHGLNARAPASRWSRPFDPAAYATEPSPRAAVTATSAAARIAAQLRRIGRGQPCLVVAHSMGGAVATALTEMVPELVAGLVYVAAFAPTHGPAVAYLQVPENEGSIPHTVVAADPAVVGAMRFDTGNAEIHAALREAFYADVDPDVADAAIALLTPDSPIAMATDPVTVTEERYGRVRHTYVVCAQDNAVRPALQRRFVREIDAVSAAPTTVVELDSSHSPFLSQPMALADALEQALLASAGTPAR